MVEDGCHRDDGPLERFHLFVFLLFPVVFDAMSKYRRYLHRRSLLHSIDRMCRSSLWDSASSVWSSSSDVVIRFGRS